ncbi:MAG: glycerate kinase [Deltaproteobacteria bacterium]
MDPDIRRRLEAIFRAAVAAVEPGRLVRESMRADSEGISFRGDGEALALPRDGIRSLYLVGGGKAGRRMGEAAASILGDRVTAGVLAVPRGQGGTIGPVRFLDAGHPVPDAGSAVAARRILSLLRAAGEEDLVIALVSGGGSSMISAPAEGISAEEMDAVTRILLRSGCDIRSLNVVRKHLSSVKGGRMAAAAYPARVVALLLSDTPGDDPSVLASGPFSPDPSTFVEAMRVLVRSRLCAEVPRSVRLHIERGVAGSVPETPKPGDPVFDRVRTVPVGSNGTALAAAAAAARRPGTRVAELPGFLGGEARECGRLFVERLRALAGSAGGAREVVLIAGGETTVTVRGSGRGGRSQEFALAAALAMREGEGMAVLAAGTDGVDGPTDAAGAYADDSTAARARRAGRDPMDHLERNDAHSLFRALSDLLVTGPTGTNVADLAIGTVRLP